MDDAPFLSSPLPSSPSLACTVVSIIWHRLPNVVLPGSGSAMGEETPQGGESWKTHFMHH